MCAIFFTFTFLDILSNLVHFSGGMENWFSFHPQLPSISPVMCYCSGSVREKQTLHSHAQGDGCLVLCCLLSSIFFLLYLMAFVCFSSLVYALFLLKFYVG